MCCPEPLQQLVSLNKLVVLRKDCEGPALKSVSKQVVPIQSLFSRHIRIGDLHATAWFGIVESLAVELLQRRHSLTGASVTSSQLGSRLCKYSVAGRQYLVLYRRSGWCLRRTSQTTHLPIGRKTWGIFPVAELALEWYCRAHMPLL